MKGNFIIVSEVNDIKEIHDGYLTLEHAEANMKDLLLEQIPVSGICYILEVVKVYKVKTKMVKELIIEEQK